VKSFVKEFKEFILSEITLERIEECIGIHQLDNESIKTLYHEDYYHNKSLKEG